MGHGISSAVCAGCAAGNCDTCPNQLFRNDPRWWLTLETGDDQAAAEPPGIKIVRPWGESGWVSGTIGEFRFCAKVYGAPSKYGINSGRVSKLEIKKGTIPVINYDRGWDIRPESDEIQEIFRAVLDYLEALSAAEEGGQGMNVVSFSGGTNSTAMIVGMYLHEIPVDLILFADPGAEQPHTYEIYRSVQQMAGKTRIAGNHAGSLRGQRRKPPDP